MLTYPQEVEIRAGSSSLGKVKALPPSILVQYNFTDFGVIRPYVGAGVNYTIFSSRKGLGGGTYALESSSLGYVAQVGADYMLDKQWGLNVDVKYIRMSTDVITNSDGAHVAVEIKRRGEIDGVEQLTRYLELMNRDPLIAPVTGVFAAQEIKPQARVLAEDRGIRCLVLDYDALRGTEDPSLRLF